MNRRKAGLLRITGALVLSLFLLQACNRNAEEPAPSGDNLPAAPHFSLPNLKGKAVRLSDFRGKVILLNFWATWCPPCREEIPRFIELYNQYRGHGFQMIGVSLDTVGPAVVEEFARKYGINYPILIANEEVVEEYGGVRGIPTTFVIDRQGKVFQKYTGYREKETFERVLRGLL